MLGIDFETTSLSPANGRVRLIQMSNGEETHVADAKDADPPRSEGRTSLYATFRSSHPGTLECLAVDHCSARVAGAPFRLAHLFTQPLVGLPQPVVQAPLAEVVVGGGLPTLPPFKENRSKNVRF